MHMRSQIGRYVRAVALAVAAFMSVAASDDAGPSPRLLVHLLDYLSKDYAGAVGAQGQVLSPSEYEEQREFSQTAAKTAALLPQLAGQQHLQEQMQQLVAMIASKADPQAVALLADALQRQVIATAHLEVAPRQAPDVALGRGIYQKNCALCHGDAGHGDGPAGAALQPPPANLTDPARMREATPLHVFNTVRIGVPGTAMPSFGALSDHESWSVAYYVLALLPGRDLPPWQALSPQSGAKGSNLGAALPAGSSREQPLAHARALLKDATSAYASGQLQGAKALALQAYLEGIEPIEPRARASDPQATSAAESRMAAVRSAIERGASLADVQAAVQAANTQIDQLQTLLNHQEIAPEMAFVAAASILAREGFEAVLLILALLGVIRAGGSRRAALWVHGGWLAGLGLGVGLWFASGMLLSLSGATREMLEATTSLLAVAVLLVVGFWLHSRTEIGRWNRFLRVKVRSAMAHKNFVGLGLIAFFAVAREAFETVLFLRTIWIDSGEQARSALGLSVLLTLGAILIAAWAVLRFSARIPVRKLFGLSAVVMALLAVILTGKGLHSLQETGVLTVTTPNVPVHWELLGLFPTYETLLPQLAVLALILVLWYYGRRPSPSQRTA